MQAVVFCIAGWEELQTASYKFRDNIFVLNRQKSKTISRERLCNFLETGSNSGVPSEKEYPLTRQTS